MVNSFRWMALLALLALAACSRAPDMGSPPTCEDIVQAAVNSPACVAERAQLQHRLRQEPQPEPYTGQHGTMPQYRW
jgi:hypothetical protein